MNRSIYVLARPDLWRWRGPPDLLAAESIKRSQIRSPTRRRLTPDNTRLSRVRKATQTRRYHPYPASVRADDWSRAQGEAHGRRTPAVPCTSSRNSSIYCVSYSNAVRCEEKHKLIEAYKTSVVHYATAVNDLNLTRGKISKVEYDRLLSSSETAREASETARLALDRHTRKHDC